MHRTGCARTARSTRSRSALSLALSLALSSSKRACHSSPDAAEWIRQSGISREIAGLRKIEEPLARLVYEREQVARLPRGFLDDALLAKLRKQKDVGDVAIDEPGVRYAVSADLL